MSYGMRRRADAIGRAEGFESTAQSDGTNS